MNLIYIVLFIFYHFNARLDLTALPNGAHPTPNHFWTKLKNEIKIAIMLSWFAINIMTNRDRVNGENSGTADCAKFNCCSPYLTSASSHPSFVNAVCHNGIGHESQTTQTGKQLDNETNNQQKRQRN